MWAMICIKKKIIPEYWKLDFKLNIISERAITIKINFYKVG